MTEPKLEFSLLANHFFNRTDVVAALDSRGKPCPIQVTNFDEILSAHISGKRVTAKFLYEEPLVIEMDGLRIGTYTPSLDSKTKFLCIDIDGGAGHTYAVADPDKAALTIANKCEVFGLSYSLEKSNSDFGWHVWILFEEPIFAASARAIGFSLIPSDIRLLNGGTADVVKSRGIEIFPKSETIKSDRGKGTMVWLPYWHAAKDGTTVFYERFTDKLIPMKAPAISPNPISQIKELLKKIERPEPPPTDTQEEPIPKKKNRRKDYDNLRKEALSRLDLTAIYCKWLTGKSKGSGWLECRDPDSETGDKNPSAGVNDTDINYERGLFHSFISGQSLSVFDFMVTTGQACNFKNAVDIVESLTGVPISFEKPKGNSAGDTLPTILVTGRQQREVIEDAWEIIHDENLKQVEIFRKGNVIVQPETSDNGGGQLMEISQILLHGKLIRKADWMKTIPSGAEVPATLPKYVSADMISKPDKNIPTLNTITGSPLF